jgi:hypothetical protein
MIKKGQFGGLIGEFAIAVFVVLFVIIFIVAFKIHVTQAMVDYYLWNKEYDIPMALFSIDVDKDPTEKTEYESSAIFLSRLHYADILDEDKTSLKNQLNPILDKWSKGVNQYTLTFDKTILQNMNECICKPTRDISGWLYGKCTDECKESTRGKDCWALDYAGYSAGQVIEYVDHGEVTRSYTCWGSTKLSNVGLYPLPVVFNGTQRTLTLSFQVLSG